MAQWLGPCTFIAEGMSLIPDWTMRILQATGCGQKIKKTVGSKRGRALFLRDRGTWSSSSYVLHTARFP